MFTLGDFEVGLTLLAQQSLQLGPGAIGMQFAECSLAMLAEQALMPGSLIACEGMRHLVAPALVAAAVGLVALPLSAYWVSLGGVVTAQGAALGGQTAFANVGQAARAAASGLLFAVRPTMPFWVAAGLLITGAAAGAGVARRGGGNRDGDGT